MTRLRTLSPAAILFVGALVLLARAGGAPGTAGADATGADPIAPAMDVAPRRVALITGANRGIGLEFARQLAADGWTVIGTARAPADAVDLAATGARVEALDVADPASVEALAKRLDGTPIDLLINNAGRGASPRSGKLSGIDFDAVRDVIAVNTIGPMRVTQALLPNLQAGAGKLIVSISSRLASVELNTNAGYYGYRESKTALNMFMRSLAAELKPDGFRCIAISPGWVRTDMGGPEATLSPEQSVGGMLRVLSTLTIDDSGGYFSYDGSRLPW
ncbi:MAG: SDR family oxidoreductase [Phycisphaeraceae bacterium]|nr:SDR family oxidoreductase [Phycisphaeraceae bacterium]